MVIYPHHTIHPNAHALLLPPPSSKLIIPSNVTKLPPPSKFGFRLNLPSRFSKSLFPTYALKKTPATLLSIAKPPTKTTSSSYTCFIPSNIPSLTTFPLNTSTLLKAPFSITFLIPFAHNHNLSPKNPHATTP